MEKKVVILEDDADIREIIEYILVEEKLAVQSHARAESFWKDVQDNHADLFLLDVMLPDGNGIDICNQLKANQSTSHIPIIIMSAHHQLMGDGKCPAEDFIKKPFDIHDFVQRIQKQLL
ncbi:MULTISPECIES: response regulator transcription factor [Olivibacter]|jgi:DNA-binding response OmpR family regulator|uniref:Response regulator receiver protein n=3 Tax=Sphingobacteriaceae TaxID=84566 RepID=F4CCD6_SPHS2|nr:MULTISPECIES: response regulator [Olivibacter]MCL4640059.1 response regulator [Olivibacter sp. UJ_SKK_5.1]MDM8176474.1 response regulator [Olivibacter sp. 47]MDX3916072.1 response regulator [Pseudosphingobacterium sp.]QEL00736.1 response regulator [Olivibacter sp. LS-1]